MSERKRLMGVIARALPGVPSTITDAVLNSKWLRDRDEEIWRQAAERAWDESVEELHDLGWLHDFAKSDAFARNPYRKEQTDGTN